MRTQSFLAILFLFIWLANTSLLRADQSSLAFMAGGAGQIRDMSLRQEIHIFLDTQREALSSIEVERSPFNAILKLKKIGPEAARVSECTAFAVDRSIIVTAAHCVHSGEVGLQQASISVIQGLSAASAILSPSDAHQLQLSHASVYYDGWQDAQTHYDCAVLKLDTPLPSNVTPFELDESGSICKRASHLETAGYTGPVLRGDPPGIRNVQSYDPDCHDRSEESDPILELIGRDKMIIDCSGDKGASGSPIYCSTNGKHYAVSIFVGESAPLHAQTVPFGPAWNFGEKVSTCARQARKLQQTLYRTGG